MPSRQRFSSNCSYTSPPSHLCMGWSRKPHQENLYFVTIWGWSQSSSMNHGEWRRIRKSPRVKMNKRRTQGCRTPLPSSKQDDFCKNHFLLVWNNLVENKERKDANQKLGTSPESEKWCLLCYFELKPGKWKLSLSCGFSPLRSPLWLRFTHNFKNEWGHRCHVADCRVGFHLSLDHRLHPVTHSIYSRMSPI